jgi:hypothetical protein
MEVNLPIASPIMCSRLCPNTSLHFKVSSYSDMVLGPLQKLLSVCAFVQAGETSLPLMTLQKCMLAPSATSQAGSQNKGETSHHRQEVAVVQEETLLQRKTF